MSLNRVAIYAARLASPSGPCCCNSVKPQLRNQIHTSMRHSHYTSIGRTHSANHASQEAANEVSMASGVLVLAGLAGAARYYSLKAQTRI